MATPVVSRAAALMLQKDPSLTPDTVKARLMKTATKSFPAYSIAADPVTGQTYQSQYDIFTVGAGYLDVWAALNSTETVASGMAEVSPTAVCDATAGNVYVVNTTSAVWGTSDVWGTGNTQGFSAVWGTSAESVNVAIYEEN